MANILRDGALSGWRTQREREKNTKKMFRGSAKIINDNPMNPVISDADDGTSAIAMNKKTI